MYEATQSRFTPEGSKEISEYTSDLVRVQVRCSFSMERGI
jgi:hypothetical protein